MATWYSRSCGSVGTPRRGGDSTRSNRKTQKAPNRRALLPPSFPVTIKISGDHCTSRLAGAFGVTRPPNRARSLIYLYTIGHTLGKHVGARRGAQELEKTRGDDGSGGTCAAGHDFPRSSSPKRRV